VWASVSGSVSLVSVPRGAIILNLRRAVKTESEPELDHLAAADLLVSQIADGKALDVDDAVPTNITSNNPLYACVPVASTPPAGNPALPY
jgi:hypothetical protein